MTVPFRLKPALIVVLCLLGFFCIPGNTRAGNKKTVALVMKSLSNPFFVRMEEGARNFARERNIPIEIFGIERETDVDRQISIVESLISRQYGAIVIAPADSKKLVSVCKNALDKGIVVVNIDNPLHQKAMDQLGILIPFIGSDNYLGARQVGNYLKAKLNGKGKVIVVEGIRGVENADLRKKGFIDAVTENSDIQVIASKSANWHTDEALSLTTALLKKNAEVDAIFCANDAMALGALQAIELLNLSRSIFIGGYDNIGQVRTEIRNGRIHATVEQHPELMAEFGVEKAWNKLNRLRSKTNPKTPVGLITYEHFNKRIALSVSTLKNTFFSILVNGAKEAAKLFGIELIVMDANNQDAQQLNDISTISDKKIDLLILNPTNSESVLPGVEFAKHNGIPVITVDRKVSAGKVLSHIESDNAQGGKMAARFLANDIGQKGKILELEGIPGTSAAYERGAGFNQEISKYKNIAVAYREGANFDRGEAKAVTLMIIEKNTQIDGIFAHNDNMILGAIDAYEQSKKELPKVLVGFDAIPEARISILDNKLSATIAQDPRRMGKLAIETAARYFRGEEVSPKQFVELSVVKREETTFVLFDQK
jgi:ribose transport system substrate-binding protein